MRYLAMVFYRFLRRLLAVLVIAGLVSQPLVAPAAAKGASFATMAGTYAMSARSGDMPCCPDEQKSNGCQGCPLAICTLMVAQAEPSAAEGIEIPFQTRRLPLALDDLIADGLIGSPPDHPPRILT